MNKINKIIAPLIVFISTWLILFLCGRHMLYIQEQMQLFQNSWSYFIENCSYNGGFAQMATEFVAQFYHSPWLGVTILTALITISIFGFKSIIKSINETTAQLPIAIIPYIPLTYAIITIEGTYPFIQFTIAILTTAAILKINGKLKTIITIIASPALFWIAGAPAMLLPIFLLIQSIAKSKNIIANTIPLAVYLIFGHIGIRFGFIGSLDYFIDYIPNKAPIPGLREYNSIVMIGWLSSIAVVILYTIICKYLKENNKPFVNYSIQSLMIIAMLGTLHFQPNIKYAQNIDFKQFNQWGKLHFLYTQEKYQELLDIYEETSPTSFVEQNYINLALYRKGSLTQDFFKYSPSGHLSLLTQWGDAPFPVAFLWAEVCSEMGFIAKSTQSAYEGNILSGPRGSSMFYKNLTEGEIIAGNYLTAEKYIGTLENTIFYKDWAKEQRKFLSDAEVANNKYYTSKRKCLSKSNSLMALVNELELLKRIIRQNPLHKSTFNFAALMTLSSGVLPAFREVITAGVESRNYLPPYDNTIQEGIITAYNNTPVFWEFYRTNTNIQQEYLAFAKALKDSKTNPMGSKAVINKQKHRYWYYIEALRSQLMQQKAQNMTQSSSATNIPNN